MEALFNFPSNKGGINNSKIIFNDTEIKKLFSMDDMLMPRLAQNKLSSCSPKLIPITKPSNQQRDIGLLKNMEVFLSPTEKQNLDILEDIDLINKSCTTKAKFNEYICQVLELVDLLSTGGEQKDIEEIYTMTKQIARDLQKESEEENNFIIKAEECKKIKKRKSLK